LTDDLHLIRRAEDKLQAF